MFKNKKHNKNSMLNQMKVHSIKDKILNIRDFIVRKANVIFPIIVVLVLMITVGIAVLVSGKNEKADSKDIEDVTVDVGSQETETKEVVIDENLLELNANTAVNDLVVSYFNAMVSGDVESVTVLHNNVIKDTTKIRIQELSKYIESYPSIEIYTKQGAVENSVLAYVYYKVLFIGYDVEVPGMQFLYLKQDENGNYAIYNEAALDLDEIEYIEKMESEDDIVALKNRVVVENDEILLDESNGIYAFMAQLTNEVDIKVGQLLAEELQEDEPIPPVEETQEPEVADETEPLMAKTTATINVRKSDSLTADTLGKISAGESITVYEKQANGWCRIDYEGSEAYVKTDYVQFQESIVGYTVIGTIKATANVNIRAEASTDAQRLGVAVENQDYDLFEVLDGWYKISYDEKVAYISSEYAIQN